MGRAAKDPAGERTFNGPPDDSDQSGPNAPGAELLAATQRYARLMEVFVSVLTHDLRNPLTAIITASQMLKPDQDVDLLAVRIRQSADRMGRLIDQLLDFSRIKMGAGLPLDLCEMDLAATGRMVVGELEVGYPDRRIHLEERGTLWGTWDRDRLAQLLSNLAGNACQHGEDPIRIQLDGGHPDLARITVENRGSIPAELVPDLFEPGGRRSHSAGLGLGLFIAQQIAVAHGGCVHLASAQGVTRFVVEIPRLPPGDENSGTFTLERTLTD